MSPRIVHPFDEARARAVAWLTSWDSQGAHRTATAGDEAGAGWLAHVTLVGSNPLFHLPQDRWPHAVDAGAVTRVAAAAAALVIKLTP